MTDVLSSEQRHKNMSHIHGKDTKPEMMVRKFLFSLGFRYRLHVKDLPGTPDIVLPKYKTAVFVNGCFWHGHENCKYFSLPKTNTAWWQDKIQKNKDRDKRELKDLHDLGWRTIIIWECQLKPSTQQSTLGDLADRLDAIKHGQRSEFSNK